MDARSASQCPKDRRRLTPAKLAGAMRTRLSTVRQDGICCSGHAFRSNEAESHSSRASPIEYHVRYFLAAAWAVKKLALSPPPYVRFFANVCQPKLFAASFSS